VREAAMLQRLGQEPLVVVCDNGSTDGTQEALRALDGQLPVPHHFLLNARNRGSSVARNQVIDLLLERGGDYLLFVDGDIELVPFSSFAMLRHLEDSGSRLGCFGTNSAAHTLHREQATAYLYSTAGCPIETTNFVACTWYGMFRSIVFNDGVRFDETEPFNGAGWGFEDNDLAFQLEVKNYVNQHFFGVTFLHRHVRSSIRIMRACGIDAQVLFAKRKQYIINKWASTPNINNGPLEDIRRINIRL
jgi:glycosyltransferase involved in cell wall biosynthesis